MKEIQLTQGFVALVDDEDHAALSAHKWHVIIRGKLKHAARWIDGKNLYMHRILLDAPTGMDVDHVNMDGLDNRRENIRLATRTQNSCNRGANKNNTSGYKGVSWHKAKRGWAASIQVGGRLKWLGCYANPEIAHNAYRTAAETYHGEFARHHGK